MSKNKNIELIDDEDPNWKPFIGINGGPQNISENIMINISSFNCNSKSLGPKVFISMENMRYKYTKSYNFWVTIEDCPKRLCKKKIKITDKELFNIYRWISLNKELLLEYWEKGLFCDFEYTKWRRKLKSLTKRN